jgi:hypothetical protein
MQSQPKNTQQRNNLSYLTVYYIIYLNQLQKPAFIPNVLSVASLMLPSRTTLYFHLSIEIAFK